MHSPDDHLVAFVTSRLDFSACVNQRFSSRDDEATVLSHDPDVGIGDRRQFDPVGDEIGVEPCSGAKMQAVAKRFC